MHPLHELWPEQDSNTVRKYAIAYYDLNEQIDIIELHEEDYSKALNLAILFCGQTAGPASLLFKDVKILV